MFGLFLHIFIILSIRLFVINQNILISSTHIIESIWNLIKSKRNFSNLLSSDLELNDSFKYSIDARRNTTVIAIILKIIKHLVIRDLNWHKPAIKFEYIDWVDITTNAYIKGYNLNLSCKAKVADKINFLPRLYLAIKK